MFSVVRRHILGSITSGAVSLAGMVLIVWKTTPETAPAFLIALFFLAFFIFIGSLATLVVFAIKSQFARSRLFDETAYESVFYDSLLQGLLVAGVIVAAALTKRLL